MYVYMYIYSYIYEYSYIYIYIYRLNVILGNYWALVSLCSI